MTNAELVRLNQIRQANGESFNDNPRNVTSGSLIAARSQICWPRQLRFRSARPRRVARDQGTTYFEIITKFRSWGFPVTPEVASFDSIEEGGHRAQAQIWSHKRNARFPERRSGESKSMTPAEASPGSRSKSLAGLSPSSRAEQGDHPKILHIEIQSARRGSLPPWLTSLPSAWLGCDRPSGQPSTRR